MGFDYSGFAWREFSTTDGPASTENKTGSRAGLF